MNRKGLGKGLGTGYKNIAPMDSHIHSLSAKGVKSYQKLKVVNGNLILSRKTKEGYRVYFDNKRLMTENSFDSKKEAIEWLEDLRSIGGLGRELNVKGLKVGDKVKTSYIKEGVIVRKHDYGYDVRGFDGNRIIGETVVFNNEPSLKKLKLNAKGSFDAGTVLQQLGGNKFRVMTGAKDFYRDDEKQEIGFKIGRNAKNVNYVRIRLNGKDLYDMEFLHGSVKGMKVKSKANDVYNDQLQEIFTEHTGMYTQL